MRATLSFKLPEEQEEYQYAIDGITYAVVIEELDNALRAMVKYEDKELIKIDDVRSMINRLMRERELK